MWWLIPLVGGGAVLVYFLARGMKPETPAAVYTPPPGAPAITSGGARYLTYIQRIDTALLTYRAAKAIGASAVVDAARELSGVLDVVKNMAAQDLAAKRITELDMANINAKIEAAKKEIA